MKTLFKTRNYLLIIAVLLACGLVVSYAQKQTPSVKSGRVELCPKIHPPLNLSPQDEKELTEILAKFDTSLYRLEAIKDGKIVKERSVGTLEVSKAIRTEMVAAQARGLTAFGPEFVPCGMISGPPGFSKEKADQAGRLIEAITPILSKYQLPNEGP
jgi:hypothetical protein